LNSATLPKSLSVDRAILEHMFETELPELPFVRRLDDAGLIEAMRDAARLESAVMARRLAAVAELYHRRLAEQDADEREQWCIDGWEQVAAEVAAAQGISRGRAAGQLRYGLALAERLPKLGELFAAGAVDFRVVSAAVFRTELMVDDDALGRIDAWLARNAHRWGRRSYRKVVELIDYFLVQLEPAALRVARETDEGRHIGVAPLVSGMAEIWGDVRAPDAMAFDRRLDELAATVCPADPRTKAQRRADALSALAARAATMACGCGSPECPTATADALVSDVVIHVLADAATIHGESPTPGYVPGFGGLAAQAVRDLAKSAKQRLVVHPKDCPPEPQYRPSRALAEFIRCRDLTCRFPGCDRPAECADIDHTVPYPLGPTHASNLKLLCRVHHLLKTFYTGPNGWRDRQEPDGTVLWTSPTGHTYLTKPSGALFFPALAVPTGALVLPTRMPPPGENRGLMMPARRQTRAKDRAARIRWERGINEARIAATNSDPPPF
jgi:5-methylcytosine-specific restriction endonuclease McrA